MSGRSAADPVHTATAWRARRTTASVPSGRTATSARRRGARGRARDRCRAVQPLDLSGSSHSCTI
jgi:hypothetical protein